MPLISFTQRLGASAHCYLEIHFRSLAFLWSGRELANPRVSSWLPLVSVRVELSIKCKHRSNSGRSRRVPGSSRRYNEPHEGAKVKDKRSILRRGLLAGAMVLGGCGASVAVAAAPAGASNTEMTAAGSATTFFMMHALFPEVNDVNPNPEVGSETQSIASDTLTCSGGVTYAPVFSLPTARRGQDGAGGRRDRPPLTSRAASTSRGRPRPRPRTRRCRAAAPSPVTRALSHLDYYAYALDGVGPLVGNDAPIDRDTPAPTRGRTMA